MASSSRKQMVAVIMVSSLLMMMVPAEACNGHPCPHPSDKCPMNAVKLGVCADVLDGLIHAVLPPANKKQPCCSLISGLADLDAAVCVCLAINAGVLGVDLDVTVDLTLLLNYCGCKVPAGFQCA